MSDVFRLHRPAFPALTEHNLIEGAGRALIAPERRAIGELEPRECGKSSAMFDRSDSQQL